VRYALSPYIKHIRFVFIGLSENVREHHSVKFILFWSYKSVLPSVKEFKFYGFSF
jgi:hypothetical protein